MLKNQYRFKCFCKKHIHFNIQHCNISAMFFQCSVLYEIFDLSTLCEFTRPYKVLRTEPSCLTTSRNVSARTLILPEEYLFFYSFFLSFFTFIPFFLWISGVVKRDACVGCSRSEPSDSCTRENSPVGAATRSKELSFVRRVSRGSDDDEPVSFISQPRGGWGKEKGKRSTRAIVFLPSFFRK
jgi:hypothetical protein